VTDYDYDPAGAHGPSGPKEPYDTESEEIYPPEFCRAMEALREVGKARSVKNFPPLDLGEAKNPPSYEELQALCLRAADALEAWSDKRHPLVQELRKAAGG
jgi:hypothetical protein